MFIALMVRNFVIWLVKSASEVEQQECIRKDSNIEKIKQFNKLHIKLNRVQEYNPEINGNYFRDIFDIG